MHDWEGWKGRRIKRKAKRERRKQGEKEVERERECRTLKFASVKNYLSRGQNASQQ